MTNTPHAGLNLSILISMNQPARVARFAEQNSFPYLVLVDADGSVANDYNIMGVPTLILVDKEWQYSKYGPPDIGFAGRRTFPG